MLREENDAALAVNDNLRQDVTELTRALERLEQGQRNDRERFRVENAVMPRLFPLRGDSDHALERCHVGSLPSNAHPDISGDVAPNCFVLGRV